MRHLVRLAGVGREDDRDAVVGDGFAGEFRPGFDPRGDGGDARRVGAVFAAGVFKVAVPRRGFLEAGDAGEEAAVHLGQDNVHGEVGGRQAAGGAGPGGAVGGGERDLEHGDVGGVEGRRIGRAAGGEGGGVDDRCGFQGVDPAG